MAFSPGPLSAFRMECQRASTTKSNSLVTVPSATAPCPFHHRDLSCLRRPRFTELGVGKTIRPPWPFSSLLSEPVGIVEKLERILPSRVQAHSGIHHDNAVEVHRSWIFYGGGQFP